MPPDGVPAEEQERAALYRSLLAGRRVLVILDDACAADQVRPLLPGSSACLVIVTSRHEMPSLVALQDIESLVLDVLTPEEAVLLLRRIIGADQIDEEPEATADLAALCAYLPLALRIAAAHVASPPRWRVSEYVRRMRRDLFGALKLSDDREAALDSALHLSCAAIEPQPRRLFRLMGTAPGTDLTAPAAAALLQVSLAQAETFLERLAGAHLIEQRVRGRFRFHDLLRGYAAALCREEEEPAECTAAVRRLLWFYAETTVAAGKLLAPRAVPMAPDPPDPGVPALAFDEPPDASAWLAAEAANLVAAAEYAAAHGPYPVAWQLTHAIRPYLWLTRSMPAWSAITQAGLRAAIAAQNPAVEVAMRGELGIVYWTSGDYPRALRQLEEALDLAGRLGLAEREAAVLGNIGAVYRETGDLERCLEHSAQACRRFSELGARVGEANSRITLSGVCADLGRLDETVDHAGRALQVYQELDNRDGQGSALLLLADASFKLGDPGRAGQHAGRALEIFEQLGTAVGQSCALQIIASSHLDSGDLERAEQAADRALVLARHAGSHQCEAEALARVADVHRAQSRHERAYAHYSQALSLARDIGLRPAELAALLGRAALPPRPGTGEAPDAWSPAADAAAALETAKRAGYVLYEAEALVVNARIRLRAGDVDASATLARRALDILDPTGAAGLAATARRVLDESRTPA